MSHKAHEAYSAANPVPKVALKSLFNPSSATERKAKDLNEHTNQDELHQNAATERMTQRMVKGAEVDVKDPVTGEEVRVKHADDAPDTNNIARNVLSLDLPTPDWQAHKSFTDNISRSAILKIILAYTILPLFLHLIPIPLISRISTSYPKIYSFIHLVSTLIPPTLIAYSLLFSVGRTSSEDFENRIWEAERERGLTAGKDQDEDGKIEGNERIRESTEWLNALLRGVWPIINTNMFTSSVDMLEDIMQSSVPKFVHSVRVSDVGQGSNALRLTSICSLPDGSGVDAMEGVEDDIKKQLQRQHVNFEVSFAYRALPSGSTAHSKAQNAHLLIEFFLGLRGVYGFKLPVWVEITGISGTARARVELIPDPPFIKTTLVTLMGLPKISIAVVPLAHSLPNMMNLPIISNFISSSIDRACAEYVAPKSLTLNLQQLICGDDILKDTEAIGVIIIHIHRATNIKKMDTRGSSESSDPYVTVAYTRQGKPLFSTRIIQNDLNPVFEENNAVTVNANVVKTSERLSLQLWDSDRGSADDMMGYVEIDVLDLIRNKNTPRRISSPLSSPDSEHRPGTLEYTVGYYAKMAPNSALETDGSDPGIPEDLKQEPGFKEKRAISLNDLEAAVLVTPPDPSWPSGILSVQVHEIRELGITMDGNTKKGEGEKGQDDDAEEQEEGEGLPSSYCTIALNDDLIYSTRVKPITGTPTFNAGTERFIRDWRTTHVSVVVRDSRMREDDPILGIVFLKLSELLKNASQITRFFPLEQGIGYGSIRISILFRPVRAKLPTHLLGFDTGTVVARSISVKSENAQELEALGKCELRLESSIGSAKISKKAAGRTGDELCVWHPEGESTEIAVQNRYSTALILTFKETNALKASAIKAMAVLWLRDLVDNVDTNVEIALWHSSDYSRLKQNYVPPNGSLEDWDNNKEKCRRIGTLQIELTYQAGITDAHKSALKTNDTAKRRIWEEVDRRNDSDTGMTQIADQQGADRDSGVDIGDENTEVDKTDVQVEHTDEDNEDAVRSHVGENNQEKNDLDGDDNHKGLLSKLKEWRSNEKELHKQHRGIMQKKPARTAVWMKENLEEAGHKVHERFTMKNRQPDVETEV